MTKTITATWTATRARTRTGYFESGSTHEIPFDRLEHPSWAAEPDALGAFTRDDLAGLAAKLSLPHDGTKKDLQHALEMVMAHRLDTAHKATPKPTAEPDNETAGEPAPDQEN